MTTTVLYIATRPPYGQMQGHKMAIRTYIKSLQSMGCRVIVAAFQIPGDVITLEDLGVKNYYLELPSKTQIALNLLSKGLRGVSLNECLYYSPQARQKIISIIKNEQVDISVADMIRTAVYASSGGVPWLLDLDDLLSERYKAIATGSLGSEAILGYLEPAVPKALRVAARWSFRKLIGREADIVSRRELHWVSLARASSLRSVQEVGDLRQRAPEARVFCLPVAVEIPACAAKKLDERPMTAVFTGGLTYQPNLDALRFYVSNIIPSFQRLGVPIPHLRVIGNAPSSLRQGLEHQSMHFLGHVPDLHAELCEAQVFFAPIVSGTGIKVKVLEAMACGLPVIGLPMALSGLRGEGGRDYLCAASENEFAGHYARLRDDVAMAKTIASAARQLAISHYSLDATTKIVKEEFR